VKRSSKLWLGCKIALWTLLLLFFANILRAQGDEGCPHAGSDRRLLGRTGCWVQRKLTIENARNPKTIWSLRVKRFSLRIDPRHPHLLIEWPARSHKFWCFRAGYRWDSNARAYIFPAIAFKKVSGPMQEYERNRSTAD
jgi:hypothetical protein